jgi:hypothetical protein
MLEEDIDEAYKLLNDREELKDRVLKSLLKEKFQQKRDLIKRIRK